MSATPGESFAASQNESQRNHESKTGAVSDLVQLANWRSVLMCQACRAEGGQGALCTIAQRGQASCALLQEKR